MKVDRKRSIFFAAFAGLWLIACACDLPEEQHGQQTLFRLLHPDITNVHFINQLDYDETVNTYTFKNFYNGGGVGLADFNNDSLIDIFLTGNLVSNKLFLNKGDLRFEDITEASGLLSSGSWSTGVSIVDINGDGWLDIYVCKSGPPEGDRRSNELFINRGNLTFSEEAEKYGLDFTGLSTHAAFFDYDRDGDLDCYLLNNSIRSIGAYDLRKDQRKIPDPAGGNKLLRNDDGGFTDVSGRAGIYTSMIGFGLGVTVGDVNKDGWADVYVSNDFFEKDYLYINQQDGTFRESLEAMVREISLGSMGADMADINNDALSEIFVTEMLPESDDRLKTTTQFESWDKFSTAVEQGYFKQFSRNVLQLNNGDGTFSEIGRLAGVHATDWSWGSLIFDMDNDGLKDIFVANGIYKDLLDQDYVNFVSDRDMVRQILLKEGQVIKRLIDSIPTNKISNFAFQNQGDLTFRNRNREWGLADPGHSNGSAYGDLDNDGDLDLVLNNVNMPAQIYQNQSDSLRSDHSFLTVVLRGSDMNTFCIGAKVTLKAGDETFYQEQFPMRGFMSSVDYNLTFGLGDVKIIDSLIVEWPNGGVTVRHQLKVNQRLTLYENDSVERPEMKVVAQKSQPIFKQTKFQGAIFKHEESTFVDFDRDRLLFNMISNEGPCLCSGDVNNDGFKDFYVGGAKNQAGSLFVQTASGDFIRTGQNHFDEDAISEDTDCVFFDADGDGKKDLYVASGGNEFSSSSAALVDRLYFNKGAGKFVKSRQLLPLSTRFESSATVEATDIDHDGDTDLFVGIRVIPGLYGIPCNGYILRNDGKGNFSDATKSLAQDLHELGMIRDAKWVDINNDTFDDLIVVGDWMGIHVFVNKNGISFEKGNPEFSNTNGWYQTVETGDLNRDGWVDLVFGNHGLNSRFKASQQEPINMYINDFDQNGSVEHITTHYYNGKSLPMVLRQDLIMQIPSLKKKYLHFEDYKGQTVADIFSPDQLKRSVTLSASNLKTSLWLNDGSGGFIERELPVEAQFAPVYSVYIEDVDSDSNPDILLGGNLYRAKPETGIYDGSYGLLLKGDGKGGFSALPPAASGVSIKGEIRGIKKIMDRPRTIVVARNNDFLQFFRY